MTTPAYLDPLRGVDDRVGDLISRMDLDEKLAQLGAVEFPKLVTSAGYDPGLAK